MTDSATHAASGYQFQDAVAPVEEAIAAISGGGFVILVDEMSRGPGVLVVAAQRVTTDQVAFMIRRGGGVISVPMSRARLKELEITLMVTSSADSDRIPFTISVDAKDGITTGISAADRWRTIQKLIASNTTPDDLVRPGHVYPLQGADGGVLRRAGYTEAAMDLVSEAGLYPAAVMTNLMNDQGDLYFAEEDLAEFARQQDLAICRIPDVIAYRRGREKLIERTFETQVVAADVLYQAIGFQSLVDGAEHLALLLGDIGPGDEVMVRVHSECLTGDVFKSETCGCSRNLDQALRRIREERRGVLLYLRQPRDVNYGSLEWLISHRSRAEESVQADRASTSGNRDQRDYGIGAQILYDLGVRTMWILTDHPTERNGIAGHGLSVLGFLPMTD